MSKSRECAATMGAGWARTSEAQLRRVANLPEPSVLVSEGGKLIPLAERSTFQRGPVLGETSADRVSDYAVLGGRTSLVR